MVVFQVLSGPNFQNTFQKRKVNAPKMLPSKELTYPPEKAYFKIIFLFPRWDISISWRVSLPGANAEFDWLYRFLLHRLVGHYVHSIPQRDRSSVFAGIQVFDLLGSWVGLANPYSWHYTSPNQFYSSYDLCRDFEYWGAMKSLQNSHASYLLSREVRPVASRPYEQWK